MMSGKIPPDFEFQYVTKGCGVVDGFHKIKDRLTDYRFTLLRKPNLDRCRNQIHPVEGLRGRGVRPALNRHTGT
jgi:hypothetical protein